MILANDTRCLTTYLHIWPQKLTKINWEAIPKTVPMFVAIWNVSYSNANHFKTAVPTWSFTLSQLITNVAHSTVLSYHSGFADNHSQFTIPWSQMPVCNLAECARYRFKTHIYLTKLNSRLSPQFAFPQFDMEKHIQLQTESLCPISKLPIEEIHAQVAQQKNHFPI